MPLLTRKKALAVAKNATTALPSSLGGSEATIIPIDLSAALAVERVDRTFTTSSLTAFKDLAGQKAVDFTFGVEMRGSNGGSAEPAWGKLLEACSMESAAFKTLTISSASGTFRHGELITGGTSGATARVVKDTHEGDTTLYITGDSGTFSGETITGTDTGVTATSAGAASSAAGFAYWPISTVEKQLTIASDTGGMAVGALIEGGTSGARGVLTRAFTTADTTIYYTPVRGAFQASEVLSDVGGSSTATVDSPSGEAFVQGTTLGMRAYMDGKSITANGCRGSVSFNFEVNRPVRMDFTFRGSYVDVTDRALPTGIDYENVDPPLWESSSIGYARNETASEDDLADEVEPCLTALTLDLANQSADRKCAGASAGLLEVFTTAREGTGSMTVEDTLEADLGWLTRIIDNETVRLTTTVGATTGNKFTFAAPGIQFTQHSEGDTDGFVTQDLTFRLTGGNLFNLSTPTDLTSIGGDNELVILYHTA